MGKNLSVTDYGMSKTVAPLPFTSAPAIHCIKEQAISGSRLTFNNPALNQQQGFTLIELIISLALGLLISAAALQLFINSINNQRVQASAADIQDATVFSLNYMQREIALANLGTTTRMTQQSPQTGIVFTASLDSKDGNGRTIKLGNLSGTALASSDTALSELLTKSDSGPNNVITPTKSDQLTIQYRAPFDSRDCEGRKVNQGDMIVERFFTRVDNQRVTGETVGNNLAIVLACDAGYYTAVDGMIQGLGSRSAILVNRVDDFSVKLGVRQSSGSIAYISIKDYLEKSQTEDIYTIDAPIVAIQLGVITRGNRPISSTSPTTYNVHGVERTIENTSNNYIRRVYQSVVMLRNNGIGL